MGGSGNQIEVLIRLNIWPTTGEIPFRMVTIATVMAAAMIPYSMDVTPSSARSRR